MKQIIIQYLQEKKGAGFDPKRVSVFGVFLLLFLMIGNVQAQNFSIDGEGAGFQFFTSTQDNPHPNSPIGLTDADLVDDGKVYHNQRNGMGEMPWRSASAYRQGSHSIGFRVQASQGYGQDRTEYWFEGARFNLNSSSLFERSNSTVSNKIRFAEKQYTGFSVFVATNFANPDTLHSFNSEFNISQWWQYGPAAPAIAVRLYRTPANGLGYVFEVRNDDTGPDKPVNLPQPAPTSARSIIIVDQAMPKGAWVDFVMNFDARPRFDYASPGYINVWANNGHLNPGNSSWHIGYSRGLQNSDATTVLGSGTNQYGLHHKIGIYRPGNFGQSHQVLFDEIRNGGSYDEVDPSKIAGNQTYRLLNEYSGKCLAIAGASQSEGASAVHWACGTSENYRWRFNRIAAGTYHMVANHSQKCVRYNGEFITQESCGTSQTKNWTLHNVGGGYYQIRPSSNSSRCMGLSANVNEVKYQWCVAGNTSQKWRFLD